MKHLKKFNEDNSNPLWVKCNRFYQGYKNTVDFDQNDYEEGDEPSNRDLLSELGDLCNDLEMSKDDVKYVLDNFNCSFDSDKLLKITYDEWVDENEIDPSLKELVERILDAVGKYPTINNRNAYQSDDNFIKEVADMIKKWSSKR